MKNLLLLAVLMLGLSLQVNAANASGLAASGASVSFAFVDGDDDPAQSTMVLKVESIVGNDAAAKRVRKALKGLSGVTNVDACTQSGNVTVTYNKTKLGCCSRISSQLEQSGFQFTTVSNNEQGTGSCAGRAAAGQANPNCSQGQNGNRPACCRQQRRNS